MVEREGGWDIVPGNPERPLRMAGNLNSFNISRTRKSFGGNAVSPQTGSMWVGRRYGTSVPAVLFNQIYIFFNSNL